MPVLSELDFGGWASFYASQPWYGHFKEEVYALYAGALKHLGSRRVLDIGAGPGHFAWEFFQQGGAPDTAFVFTDASAEMLKIAQEKLLEHSIETRTCSFNQDGWCDGLGRFDAIVSNNALFHVKPERLERFYAEVAAMLNPGGVFLNQQSFGWRDHESPYGKADFPKRAKPLWDALLPDEPGLDNEARQAREAEKVQAKERHRVALEAAAKDGLLDTARQQSGYQFLSVETHLGVLRKVGLDAGCVWRKREFAVLCAFK